MRLCEKCIWSVQRNAGYEIWLVLTMLIQFKICLTGLKIKPQTHFDCSLVLKLFQCVLPIPDLVFWFGCNMAINRAEVGGAIGEVGKQLSSHVLVSRPGLDHHPVHIASSPTCLCARTGAHQRYPQPWTAGGLTEACSHAVLCRRGSKVSLYAESIWRTKLDSSGSHKCSHYWELRNIYFFFFFFPITKIQICTSFVNGVFCNPGTNFIG